MPPKKNKGGWTGGNGSGNKGGGKKKVDASVLGLAPAVPMMGGLGGLGGLVGGGLPAVPGMDLGMVQQIVSSQLSQSERQIVSPEERTESLHSIFTWSIAGS